MAVLTASVSADQNLIAGALSGFGKRYRFEISVTLGDAFLGHSSLLDQRLLQIGLKDIADPDELAPPKARLVGVIRAITECFNRFSVNMRMRVSLVPRSVKERTDSWFIELGSLDANEVLKEYQESFSQQSLLRRGTFVLKLSADKLDPKFGTVGSPLRSPSDFA